MAGLLGEGQGLLQAPAPVDPFGGYQGLLSANQAATVPGSGLLGNAQRTHARMQEQPMLHRAALASMPIPVVGDVLGLANDAAWMIADPERRTWLDFLGAGLGALPFVPSAAMTVFHGSPHLFKELPGAPFGKFDHSKMGTGEGAQAFGWGTYLADKPGTATSYKDALSGGNVDWVNYTDVDTGQIINDYGSRITDALDAVEDLGYHPDQARAIVGHLEDEITEAGTVTKYLDDYDVPAENVPAYQAAIEKLKGVKYAENPGHLYTVDLPDEQIEKMLDWDAPFSEQPEQVRSAVTRVLEKGRMKDPSSMTETQIRTTLEKIDPSGNYRFDEYDGTPLTRDDLLEQWEMTREYDPESFDEYLSGVGGFLPDQPGHGVLHQLEAMYSSDEAIAKALNKEGIPGIKFYDAGSRYLPANLPDNPIANEARGFIDKAGGNVEAAMALLKESDPHSRWASSEIDEIRKVIKSANKKPTRNYVVFDESVMTVIGRE